MLFVCPPALAVKNYRHGSRDVPKIAITIDDCYDKEVYEGFLDVAKQYGIKLTYFVSGIVIKDDYKALFERTFAEGHEIGSHGYRHRDMLEFTNQQTINELRLFEVAMKQALGYEYKPRLIRFPYGVAGTGAIHENLYRACQNLGYDYIIHWDVVLGKPDTMLQKIQNGSIVLFHTNREDLRCFRELAPKLIEKGFIMTSIADLLGLEE